MLVFLINKLRKRSLSPLITTILLIIVTFALIGIVLSWGKGFTNNTKTTLDNFQEEYTQNNTAMFKVIKFFPNNKLIINDLMSETDLNIVGYRILSDHNFPGLNTIVMLPTPIIFSQGDSDAISITRPPANKFDIQLLTNDNKYITVSNIQNYALEPVAPTITSPSNGSSFPTDTDILFTQTTTGGDGTYSCEWKVESTIISTSCDDFNYSFSSGGAKTITLKVTDLEGNTKTVSNTITILPPLSVTITSPVNNFATNSGTLIDFNSSISGGTGSYSCEWYDGLDLLSNNCDFTTSFSLSGTYDISLIVTDSDLVSSKDVNIIIYAPLSASITSPTNGSSYSTGDSISFSSSISGGSGSPSCTWDSNIDAILSTSCSFLTSSLSSGTHLIALSVTDGSETVDQNIIVTINISCPTGFVVVPGNATYGLSDFCVAKYEMKIVGNDYGSIPYNSSYIAESRASGTPWVYISQTESITECESLGSGYHLITNDERMVIARNIAQVSDNWSGGSVGSGYIYSGHNDGSPNNPLSASTNDADGYYLTGNSTGNQRRTLKLSNGNIIWDFSGNVDNWSSLTINAEDEPYGSSKVSGYLEYPDITHYGTLGYDDLFLINNIYNSAQGIGKVYTNAGSTGLRGSLFGGRWNNESIAGSLALNLANGLSTQSYSIGFRCSYNP